MANHKSPSAIRVEGGIAYIYLREGYEAAIDASDVPLVSNCVWRLLKSKNTQLYACTGQTRKGTFTTLHRLLFNPPDKLGIDHKDGNGLNNRRNNLRQATDAQNNANRGPNKRNQLGIKGVSEVSRLTSGSAYVAKVGIGDGRARHLGTFKTPEDASNAYFNAARDMHGEFARK